MDKAIAKYHVAVNKNISESEILWSKYNTMLVFNSILIAAIGISYQDNIHLPWFIIIFLPIVGLITCSIWFFTTHKGFRWIDNWIVFARDIESEHLKDPKDDKIDKVEFEPILRGNTKHISFIRINGIEIGQTEFASYILIGLTAIIYLLFAYNICNGYFHFQQERKALPQYYNHHSPVIRSNVRSRL